MAPISSQAYRIYGILAAHVNQDRGDQQAWPTMDTLAELVGVSRGDKLARYIYELEELGAVTVLRRQGMPARNIYVVHETPLEEFAGPMTVAAWYHVRKANAQVTPVPPSRGVLDDDPKGQTPVPPSGGVLVPPLRGDQVAPSRGVKQPRTNNHELTEDQEPPNPHASAGEPDPKINPATPIQLPRQTCGRVHGPEVPCRACGTNPRAVAAAASKPARQPWCGTCDQQTRQRLNGDGFPYRCPDCHPLAAQAVA